MYKQMINRATVIVLLIVGSLTACKQTNGPGTEPSPELSSRVVGQYTLKQIAANGQTSSAVDEDLQGGAKISRVSANSVSLELSIIEASTGDEVLTRAVSDINVTDAGNNEVSLIKESSMIGKGGANKLSINVVGGSGVAYVLLMTK